MQDVTPMHHLHWWKTSSPEQSEGSRVRKVRFYSWNARSKASGSRTRRPPLPSLILPFRPSTGMTA